MPFGRARMRSLAPVDLKTFDDTQLYFRGWFQCIDILFVPSPAPSTCLLSTVVSEASAITINAIKFC